MSYVARRFQHAQAGLSLDTEALSRYTDLIDLSIGDTDFITDRRIIEAAYADALGGATRYGFPQGDPQLIDAIQAAWREDFGQQVPKDEIIVTASSCLGMYLALTAILNPGDEVLVISPYFAVYKQQIEMNGGVCVEVPTYEADGWSLRPETLRAAVTPRTRAIIFNNPANPTGKAYTMEDMRLIAETAQENDLVILADEIYTRYLYQGTFVPMRTLPCMAERTVTLNSFSKNFMMTGWRVGFIVAPKEIVDAIGYANGAMIYTAPSVSQRAAIRALALREDIRETYITRYKNRVFYATERINAIPYMTLVPPMGTFYLFPGIEKTGLSSAEFTKAALETAHVLVSPGSVFGKTGEGHVRIACTANTELLKEAFDRLSALKFGV